MTDTLQGFYSIYMASKAGESVAVVAMADDVICGAAMDGTTFDGTVSPAANGQQVRLKVVVPPSGYLIQDFEVGPEGLAYELSFTLPEDFAVRDYVTVQTPYGPVNARFRLLRGIP